MTNKKNLGIIGLVVLAVAAGILIYRDTRTSKIEITDNVKVSLEKSGVDMTGKGEIKILPMGEQKLPPAPSLDRPTDFSATIDPKYKATLLVSLDRAIASVKKDPKGIDGWIDLGLQRKELGDYEGARDAWEYAKALGPNNLVPYSNLGDLYHFYLKDYQKSEQNWRMTVSLQPDYAQGYRGLYELYTYSMKEKAGEIPAVLKQGIKNVPLATDLAALLAEYEKTLTK